MIPIEEVTGRYYHIKTHGGLGDCLWVIKKLCNLDAKLYLSVANENRHRPRRVGAMLDHLKCVAGWSYDEDTFTPVGDWTDSEADPACAIGKRWSDLRWKPNTRSAYRIECNRWLESGRRIEDWLPDLPTTHRIDWIPPAPPSASFKKPSVVLHVAGWPDVPDATWVSAIRLFSGLAHVYVVGGSYDHRPRKIVESIGRRKDVTLLEDVPWEDLFGVLTSCDYCFGHASGFTAIADTLGVRGATFNPRTVPKLIGTWNDRDHNGMIHVDKVADLDRTLHAAYLDTAKAPAATWPPTSVRGAAIVADTTVMTPAVAAVYAAASACMPRQVAFVFDAVPAEREVAAAAVDAVLDAGEIVQSVTLAGATPPVVASLYAAAARTTRRPIIDTPSDRRVVLDRPVSYGLTVVVTNDNRKEAVKSVVWAWSHTSAGGTVLAGGPGAREALTALGAAKRVVPGPVAGVDGWYYLHRAV